MHPIASLVQWQNASLPSWPHGFDSRSSLHFNHWGEVMRGGGVESYRAPRGSACYAIRRVMVIVRGKWYQSEGSWGLYSRKHGVKAVDF